MFGTRREGIDIHAADFADVEHGTTGTANDGNIGLEMSGDLRTVIKRTLKPKSSSVSSIDSESSNPYEQSQQSEKAHDLQNGEPNYLSVFLDGLSDQGELATTKETPHPTVDHGGWRKEISSRIGVLSPSQSSLTQVWEAQATSIHKNDVSSNPFFVSYYQFLAITNLAAIPPHDFQFLKRQGCLHVPSRPVLNEFVCQYFLNLQPILPILDEGAFWDIYAQRRNSRLPDGKISLLLFQAMLFACCNVSKAFSATAGAIQQL